MLKEFSHLDEINWALTNGFALGAGSSDKSD